MPILTVKQLRARDAKRDLNAELLAATADLAKGRIGRVHVPNQDGGFSEFRINPAELCAVEPPTPEQAKQRLGRWLDS